MSKTDQIYYAIGEPEHLVAIDIDGALEEWLADVAFREEAASEDVVIKRYKPMQLTPDHNIFNRTLEDLMQTLDEEFGDPEGDAPEITNGMEQAMRTFAEAIIAEYPVWACEEIDGAIRYHLEADAEGELVKAIPILEPLDLVVDQAAKVEMTVDTTIPKCCELGGE